ncbi:MAG: hypothetical protein WC584_00770 [Candidatus Pacearchaeota archaeon]
MNKAIIFDSGTLISLSMSGLLDSIRDLKRIFNGHFLITKDVKEEIIDKPLTIKKFELEALRIKQLLDDGVLESSDVMKISKEEIDAEKNKFINIANATFYARGKEIHIIDFGEASCLALSKILSEKKIENVIAVDERTTRLLGEKPDNIKKIMGNKLHTNINSNKENYKLFQGFKFIRSTELIYVAYKKGFINIKDGTTVLDALLYALMFSGCSISSTEINDIKKMK